MGKPIILIVEDEYVIAADLQNRLRSMGYQADLKANNGLDALELAEKHRPDLVLMDIGLQGSMDGVEAASLIRERHGIPVLFLTALADDQLLERVKLSEPFGYLIKPFQDRELKSNIGIALYRASLEAERDQLTKDLQKALNQVKQLSGLLPICASCKKIRDDKGEWSHIEAYISEHSDANFSHGICPDCAARLYPGLLPGDGDDS